MKVKNKGVFAGMSGVFAGALATQMVAWEPIPKACLAAGVCGAVCTMIMIVLSKRQEKQLT